MKTISEGTGENQRKLWAIGLRVSCFSCKFEAEVEREDLTNLKCYWHYTRHGRSGFGVVEGTCPKCGEELRGTCGKDEFHARIKLHETTPVAA